MLATTRAALQRSCLLFLATAVFGCDAHTPSPQLVGGQPERGKSAIERYGCVACHTIPGLPGHGANIGPPLAHMAARAYVAGVLPNTPENLVRWLRNPPQVDARTVMPNLGVSHEEAVDIAAYLYSVN